MDLKEYTSPIGISSQFRFCGTSFRIQPLIYLNEAISLIDKCIDFTTIEHIKLQSDNK